MKVEIISKKRVFDRFFKIEEATLRHERYDGGMTGELTRFSFERGESVAVLLYDPGAKEIILVEQFRYPAYSTGSSGWLLEIVAGSVSPGEGLEATACKEVLEETGYVVTKDSLIKMGAFFVSPGGTSERLHLYLAEVSEKDKTEKGGGNDHEDEDIRVARLPFEEALAKAEVGELEDAKTAIALFMLEKRLRG